MAPRTLKETYSRKKSSEFVESAVAVHGGGIAATLTEKLTAELQEGEEMPDISFYLQLMARRMGRLRTTLVEAAEAHIAELANDDPFRKMREEAMAELTRAYLTARQTVADGYSPEDAAAFGFEVNVATEPAQMELQIERLLVNFAKPEVQLSQPRYPAVAFDPAAGEAMFRPLLEKLQTARKALNQEQRKAHKTLLVKSAAVAANDLEFGHISRCLEALFGFADQPALARRLRPSSRRPGRRLEAEDEGEGEGETPPAPDGEPPEGDVIDPASPATAGSAEATSADPITPATAATTVEDPDDDEN